MRRGDVFSLMRRLGFGAPREAERVVVVQIPALNQRLRTTVVVPLHPNLAVAADKRTTVRVPAREVGAASDHVALATGILSLPAGRLAPGPVGSLEPRTLAELDRVLRLVLGL